jgi:hypothetical protein
METIEVKSYVGALCRPSLCITRDVKLAEAGAMEQRATRSPEPKCRRCSDCGHAHEACTSTKPIWGRDWRQYRERRRHIRRARRPEKRGGKSVAGAEMSTSVCGRIKEFKDFKRDDTAQRKLRQVEWLKEVAQVSDALEMEPATRSAVPGQ